MIDEADEAPTTIRFFRKSMQNMISLALKDVEVRVVPSRATNALYAWLEDREKSVYPTMEGYNARMKETIFGDLDSMKEPSRMPEELVTEKVRLYVCCVNYPPHLWSPCLPLRL